MGFDINNVRVGASGPPKRRGVHGMGKDTAEWIPLFQLAIANKGEWVETPFSHKDYEHSSSRGKTIVNHLHRQGALPDPENMAYHARSARDENGDVTYRWYVGYHAPDDEMTR